MFQMLPSAHGHLAPNGPLASRLSLNSMCTSAETTRKAAKSLIEFRVFRALFTASMPVCATAAARSRSIRFRPLSSQAVTSTDVNRLLQDLGCVGGP